jgi:hypothetical protein
LNFNFAWSHAISDPASFAGQGEVVAQLPTTDFRIERGNSDTDVRRRAVLMGNYELPFGKSLTGFRKGLLGGWQLNLVGVLSDGLPFSITNASAKGNMGIVDRPNRIQNGTLSNRTIQNWFSTSAFVAQTLYTAGNSGVNILQGPPLRHLDLSVFKQFPLKERYTLTFRAESFNLTNTPNFGQPDSGLGDQAFGTISNTANNQPRNIQFALRLAF